MGRQERILSFEKDTVGNRIIDINKNPTDRLLKL